MIFVRNRESYKIEKAIMRCMNLKLDENLTGQNVIYPFLSLPFLNNRLITYNVLYFPTKQFLVKATHMRYFVIKCKIMHSSLWDELIPQLTCNVFHRKIFIIQTVRSSILHL